ncbi:MAG: amidohydrolase family protein [Flavobacteriaceae bacterium]|nr:amidohydrolase family protein [Flavobacteriaceae bacterium]
MKKLSISIVITLFILGCKSNSQPPSPTSFLITDVNIVDVASGSILENQQVVIDSGRIISISDQVTDPEAFGNVINGSGKYVIPGLAEMHAHIPSPNTSRERLEETLFLYLSNGITTIRGMLGHPMHLELRKEVADGEVLGPRIFTSSPSLNGSSVSIPEEARSKVTTYAEAGYDFLKIHPGIKRAVFDTLVTTANEKGIAFAGHVPVDVGIRHALESGFASIDHIDGYLEGLVPVDKGLDANANGFFGYNFTDETDLELTDELVSLTKENQVWIVPTQSLFERWFAPTSAEEMLSQPEMRYMPSSTLSQWQQRKLQSTGPDTGFDTAKWERFIQIRRDLLKSLHENGHGMLLGSDAPQLFNVPGFSIHHEMEGMLRAGLTPLEILRTGTMNPAKYFGMEAVFGQVKEELEADLILIDGNPLEDLNQLKKISGVMVRGHWISKEEIDQRLESIANNAQNN